jgi:hypothetical protein
MDYREGNSAKEGFSAEPEHGSTILSHAPENGWALELRICLSNYVNSSILEVL